MLACLQVSPASARRILCNNNRRKELLAELFLSAVILPLVVFHIVLSNLLACLTWLWLCLVG